MCLKKIIPATFLPVDCDLKAYLVQKQCRLINWVQFVCVIRTFSQTEKGNPSDDDFKSQTALSHPRIMDFRIEAKTENWSEQAWR